MTVMFGADYLRDLQLRTEKESVLNSINYALTYVKSSNYYEWNRFTYFDVVLGTTGIVVETDAWSGFWQDITLLRSTINLSWSSDTIRLSPYKRACEDVVNQQDVVSFSLQSNFVEDSFCFDRDMRLCKLFVVSCP